jgi:hypothetical protein
MSQLNEKLALGYLAWILAILNPEVALIELALRLLGEHTPLVSDLIHSR